MHLYNIPFFAILLLTILGTPQVHAEDQPASPIRIRGIVVSTREGLTLNDGVKDYFLLGIDNIGIEGRTCIIFGNLVQINDQPTIDVYEVQLLSEEDYEDTIGLCKDRHTLTRRAQHQTVKTLQLSPYALEMSGMLTLNLHMGEGRWTYQCSGHKGQRVPIAPTNFNIAIMARVSNEQFSS